MYNSSDIEGIVNFIKSEAHRLKSYQIGIHFNGTTNTLSIILHGVDPSILYPLAREKSLRKMGKRILYSAFEKQVEPIYLEKIIRELIGTTLEIFLIELEYYEPSDIMKSLSRLNQIQVNIL